MQLVVCQEPVWRCETFAASRDVNVEAVFASVMGEDISNPKVFDF